MQRTRIKICGITRVEDAVEAERLGADALGLNFYEKSARVITPDRAALISSALSPLTSVVGLFVNPTRELVEQVISQVPLNLLQFHGDEDDEFCNSFRFPWIKAIRVRDAAALAEQVESYPSSRGLLLDSFVAGEPGGTGKTFDWSAISRLQFPFVLAGGLSAENVAEAIVKTLPYAVDVSSGVESSPGVKDAVKMRAFVEAVGRADSSARE